MSRNKVTSVSTTKTSGSARKPRGKVKHKEHTVVTNSTSAYKSKSSSSTRKPRGKYKQKSVFLNNDGTATVSTSTLRNPEGRTRVITNKKRAKRKVERSKKRFQKQINRKL